MITMDDLDRVRQLVRKAAAEELMTRFTSVSAERVLLESGLRRQRRRDVRDKVAAAVMLQAYLDQQG